MPESTLPSFRFPKLSGEQARLQNALSIRQWPDAVPFGAGTAVFRLLPEPASFEPAASLTAELDGERWTVELSSLDVLLRHPALAGFQDLSPLLPDAARLALLETLFRPLLNLMRQKLGTAISLLNVQLAPRPVQNACAAGAVMELPACEAGPALSVTLRLVPESVEHLLPLLRSRPLRKNGFLAERLAEVPLESVFEAGYLQISRQDALRLAPGDILLPDAWLASEGTLLLHISAGRGGWLGSRCTFREGRAELLSPLAFETEPCMDDDTKQELDVRLSFELERRTITVRELEALTPGYVFTLDADLQAPVTLRANGKALGRGRLVDLGGTLGVQLTETL
ncbi:type III secretion system cytoplasmic ring protein SctQ [uncultured Mailhella sp.]|uniref:type III secretion system cytoplasmic ring protein SctQ n=1 Tax=uncultured Mailhella sp. TaxID=1981031 RepID=UPI0026397046|nr:type III secretion system cytoplasmic ring protein SctQ [uncultured Mailhella sp.]